MRPFRLTIPRPVLQGLLPLTGLVLLLLATMVLGYVLILDPARERARVAEEAYQAGKHTQAELEAWRRIQIKAKAAEHRLDEIWRALPTKDEFSILAMTITDLGRAEHLVIPGMSYTLDSKKKDEGLPIGATLSFSATGDYNAFSRFVYRLEHATQYLVIESLDVARAPQSEKTAAGRVSFHVKVTTFLRPLPPQATAS